MGRHGRTETEGPTQITGWFDSGWFGTNNVIRRWGHTCSSNGMVLESGDVPSAVISRLSSRGSWFLFQVMRSSKRSSRDINKYMHESSGEPRFYLWYILCWNPFT